MRPLAILKCVGKALVRQLGNAVGVAGNDCGGGTAGSIPIRRLFAHRATAAK